MSIQADINQLTIPCRHYILNSFFNLNTKNDRTVAMDYNILIP
jgi:hypothetical protein